MKKVWVSKYVVQVIGSLVDVCLLNKTHFTMNSNSSIKQILFGLNTLHRWHAFPPFWGQNKIGSKVEMPTYYKNVFYDVLWDAL